MMIAKLIVKNFFEVLVSPGFTKSALKDFTTKKKIVLINSAKFPKLKKNHLSQ